MTASTAPTSQLQKQSLISTIFFLAALAVLGGALWLKFAPKKFGQYENLTHSVQIKYPEQWEVKEIPGVDGLVVVFAPQKEEEKMLFRPTVSVTFTDLKKKMSLKEVKEQTKMQMAVLFQKMIITKEEKPIMLSGHPGEKMVFVGQGVETPLQYFYAWGKFGSRVYVITYTALASDYDRYHDLVETMVRSFKVTKEFPDFE